MKIDNKKLDLILARKCMTASNLRPNTSPETICKIRKGENVRTDVVGRIAKMLGVDPADIVEMGE